MEDESGEKPDMDDVEDVAPSGDLKDDQDGESGKSSKLDKLLQRLHGQGSADHSRESSPDPSVKDAGQGGRQSRRKAKVTRKVVDEDERSMDVGSSAAERSDVDMVDAAMDMAIQEFLNSADKDPEEDISNDNKKDEEEKMDKKDEPTDDKQKEESIDVDEEGNLILPEGTVVVEPEAVTDNKPVFKGPEFRSSRSSTSGVKSGVHAGEVDLNVVHCSSCNHQINTNTANSVKRHPVLKVVLCKRCYNWYTSDEIVQDEDGMDEQCRWCGEGGDLLCCDYCHNAFCKGCIRRNLGRGELSHLLSAGEDSKWHCYVCDPKPLAEIIYNCNQIIEAVEKRDQKNKEREKKNKEREEALARRKQDEKKKKTQVQVQPRQQPAQQQRHGGKAQVIQQKGSIINLTKQPQSVVIQSGTQNIQSIKPGTQRQIIGQVSAGNVSAEWNFRLNENNVMPIIDRAMMVTESMHMLLSSLREDIQKAGTSSSKTATKQDCSGKLKRAFNAFNKSFIDLSLFSQKTSSQATVKKLLDEQQRANKQGLVHGRVQPQGRIQPQGNIQQRGRIQVTQQPVLPVRLIQHGEKIRVTPSGNTVMQQKGKQMPVTKQQPIMPKPNGKVEIIELLDSDDESSKSKTPPKKQSDEKKEDSDSDKSEDEKTKKKGFQLKVALGGPGHKLKGPLSKRKQFEDKERAKEEKAAKEQKEKEDKEKENKDLDKEKEDKESGNEDQDEDNNQDSNDNTNISTKSNDNTNISTKSNDNTNISTKEHEDVEKMADDDDNHDKIEEPVAETNQEESKEEAMDVDLDAGDAEEPEQKKTEEKDAQDENKSSDAPVEDDQNTNEENGDLEDFKTIEEQLKQLNGDFSGVGMDEFNQSGSKNYSQSATPNKSGGDAKVVQLDGALDNHESSSNADSPGSTSGVKKSYEELYNSVQFDPLFNLDDLSNSASTASEVDNEVMFDLGDGDNDNELGQDSEKQFDFGANENTEDSDLENNEQESIENMDNSGESNLDIQPDEDIEPERPVRVTKTVQQSPVRRSRADIEAQRLLHKELLDDSGENSNESSDDTHDDDDDNKDDDDEELNKKEKVSKKSSQKNKQMSDEEYNPKKDAGQLKEDRKLGSSRLRSRNARGKGGKKDLRVIKKRAEESDSESDNEKEEKKKKKSRKHSKHAENERDTKSKSKKHSKDSEKSSDDTQSKEELNSDSDFESKKDPKKSKDNVEKGKDSKKSKDKKTRVSGSELSGDGNESEKSNEDGLKKKNLQKCKELKKDRKISKDKKSDVENSDLGEDFEKRDKKDKKHSKKLEKTTARESDSPNFDSDLERDIDELAKMPQLKEKRKTKKSADRKDESDKEIKDKASKQKTKTVKVGRQTRQSKKDLIEDMSSGEDVDQPEEEEEPDSDKASVSSGSDMETKRHQAAAEDDDMDSKARKALLAEDSSGEDSEDSDIAMIRDEKDPQKTSSSKKPASKASSQADEEEDYDSDDITPAKNRVHNALLDAKLSDSDSDEFENFIKKRKKADSSGDTSDDSTNKKKKSKKSKKDSSDSSSDSDSKKKKKKGQKGKGRKKKKGSSSSNSDSDSDEDGKSKKKKKRRRVKMETDSDEGSHSDDSANGTPGKKRKHIRKILKDKKLSESTLSAAKAEEERRKRVIERQKLYNEKTEEDKNSPTKCIVTTQLVLEASEEDKPVVQVSKTLIRKLKPHQVDAVKFLWDCCAETCKRLKKEDGSGCILAHCMGLGKTLSVITFISTLMSAQKKTKIKTCLVVCPLNTVLNWQSEFEKWLEEEDAIDVWEMSGIKDNPSRGDALRDWHESGGIMIMGYEMYRNLATSKNIRKKKLKAIMTECLVDPGPDVVVCDEGHLLKNDASSLSKAMNNIRTRRRVVLTGTPLQNNLVEYHCMVDFVKPNLLGSRKEFTNRFVHPMSNGQCSDSTAHDVKIMKRRAHILHETLAGCVQRRDYSALTKFLLPKLEYVVSIRLTPIQIELYQKYLDRNLQSMTVDGRITNRGARLFTDYIALSRIWTHPWALRLDEIRKQNKRMVDDDDDEEDSADDSFIDDADSDESEAKSTGRSSSSESGADKPKAKNKHTGIRSTRNNPNLEGPDENGKGKDGPGGADSEDGECVSRDWWGEHLSPEDKYKAEIGSKIFILAEVLKMCEAIGDKVLVFSQSLLSLNLIEDFLEYWDGCSKSSDPENQLAGTGTWVSGLDYHRLDGTTSAAKRRDTTADFNDPDNPRMRLFLISTRAGSLGINLVSANRVIVFDASWNPTHDVQSIFRVYRFGQTKPVYVYRFLAQGTMEEKIYERQVTKQSLAHRIIDEHQIERHFSSNDLQELYNFKPDRLDDPDREEKPTPKLPKDRLLAELLSTMKDHIVTYHEHDSLLENITEECLTEEERKAAWEEFEAEKKGLIKRGASYGSNTMMQYNMMLAQQQQAQYMNQNMNQPANDLQMIVPEAEQIARAIYAANPGISQDILQQKVHMYLQQRMEQQKAMIAQRQREQQMQQEIMKLQKLRLERYRQQEYVQSMMQNSQPHTQFSSLMQQLAGQSTAASTGDGSAVSSRSTTPPQQNGAASTGLLDMLKKDTQNK